MASNTHSTTPLQSNSACYMMRKWVQAVMMEPSLCKPDIQRQHIFIIVVCLFILQMSSKIVQHLTFLAGWTPARPLPLVLIILPGFTTLIASRTRLQSECVCRVFCITLWFSFLMTSLLHDAPTLHFFPRALIIFEICRFLIGMRGIWFGMMLNGIAMALLIASKTLSDTLIPPLMLMQSHIVNPIAWMLRLGKWSTCFMLLDPPPPYVLTQGTLVVDVIWIGFFVLVAEVVSERAHCRLQMEWRATSIHKSQFVARMSHELRTPLFGILGCLEMLMMSKVDAQQKSLLQMGGTCTRSLMALIDDILDMSKIEVGKMEFERKLVRTDDLLDESLSVIWSLANKKGIRLRSIRKADLPRYFVGDRVRNRQVLVNLLSNSVKFTPPHGTITLFTQKVKSIEADVGRPGAPRFYSPQLPTASMSGSEFNEYILFKVTDTGIGLEPAEMERIFKPFEQADVSIARSFGGSGLGLTISASLVAQMGGKFFVSSEGKNRGTTFQYYIPYVVPTYTLPTKKFGKTPSPKPASGSAMTLGSSSLKRYLFTSIPQLSLPNLPMPRSKATFGISSDDTDLSLRDDYSSELEDQELDSELEAASDTYDSDSAKKRSKHRRAAAKRLPKLPSTGKPAFSPSSSPKSAHRKSVPNIHAHDGTESSLDRRSYPGASVNTNVPCEPQARVVGLHPHDHAQICAEADAATGSGNVMSRCEELPKQQTRMEKPRLKKASSSGDVMPPHILFRRKAPNSWSNARLSDFKSQFDAPVSSPFIIQESISSACPILDPNRRDSVSPRRDSSLSSPSLSPASSSPLSSPVLQPLPPKTDPICASCLKLGASKECPLIGGDTPPIESVAYLAGPTPSSLPLPSLSTQMVGRSTLKSSSSNSCSNSGLPQQNVSSSTPPAATDLQPIHDTSSIHPTIEPTLVTVTLPSVGLPQEKPVSILVAEDNVINQRILELMLGKLGHKCHLAGNGLQALKRVSEYKYDLIFMDIEMPELPGPETAKRIREMGITTPIVALSAHVLNVAKEQALSSGMNQYITKPVKVDTLYHVLQRWIPEKVGEVGNLNK